MGFKPVEDHFSYGRYLRQCRLEKGISIEALSRSLKITVELLDAMEREDHSRFPADVYTRGFLRTFAKAVGADERLVIDSYNRQAAAMRSALDAEESLKAESALFWKKALFSGLALFLLICLTLFIARERRVDGKGREAPGAKITSGLAVNTANGSEAADNVSGNGLTQPPGGGPAGGAAAEVSDRFILDIETIEDTWIKIIADHQKPREYSLRPGDRLSLKAEEGFNILVGNAAGVRLFLNKKPVPIDGESGQVISLELP